MTFVWYGYAGLPLNLFLSLSFTIALAMGMVKKPNIPYAGQQFFADPFDSANPCVYPSPDESGLGCNLPEELVKQYRICDATGNAFSYTEGDSLWSALPSYPFQLIAPFSSV